jgi:hypothetical protein
MTERRQAVGPHPREPGLSGPSDAPVIGPWMVIGVIVMVRIGVHAFPAIVMR